MAIQNKPASRNTSRSRKPVTEGPEIGRIQPQARELEEAVLGALMLEKDAYTQISDILTKPEAFYDKSHELIFTAIRNLAINQRPIDILTVVEELRRSGDLETIGGAAYIAQLSQKVVSSAHIEYHARIIAQKHLSRQLITFASDVANKAFDETNDVDELMQDAEAKLFGISNAFIKKEAQHVNPIVDEALRIIEAAGKRADGYSGLQTGFHELDKITSGWQNSDLIIIAARPAMGKTAFVLSMAKNMAVHYDTPVALFSLEMANVQLVNRLIVNVTEISGEKLKNGRLEKHEHYQLLQRVETLRNAPIYIDDTPGLSVFELRTKARRLVREHGVKCIIIDYLQLMNANGMNPGNREQEVSIISRSLKGLAKELNIPIIALSQLNRGVENRTQSKDNPDAKRPQLSDMRESGAIEQDADIVCMIHRPEYYKIMTDAHGNDTTGKAEIIIAKHRNGATGDVVLRFKNEFARFQNLDDDHVLPDVIPSKANGNAAPIKRDEEYPF